jgi:hypothetical protein
VEVKIGVKGAARELALESNESPEAVTAAVQAALAADDGLLILEDEKGHKIVVVADQLAYVEIGEQIERRVGFGTM